MGFNLGMAAAAYQGAMAEQRRLRDDEFTKAQHAYAVANMDEVQGRRGYRDNAAALADAEVSSARTLLPKRSAVAAGALDAQAADQELVGELRPTLTDTAKIKADTGLVQAKTAQSEADNVHAWDDARRESNGQRIDAMILEDESKAHDMRQNVYASLYQSGAQEKMPEHDLVARFNSVARSKLLFPELHGKTAAAIKRVKGADGDDLALYDADGAVLMKMPVAQLKAAHDKASINTKSIIKLSDGQNAYRTNPDGTITPLTSNKKTLAPRAGLAAGAGVPRSSAQERLVASMQAEAKAAGQSLSTADALAKMKADPQKWAVQLDKADERLKFESDPAKRLEIQNENRRAVGAPQLGPAGTTNPGLSTLSPASQAAINAALKPGT